MATPSIEERLTALEIEVAQLKKCLNANPSQADLPWCEKIVGTFADSEEYDEAMRLGREYRESLRPKDDEDADWVSLRASESGNSGNLRKKEENGIVRCCRSRNAGRMGGVPIAGRGEPPLTDLA